jgi:hypothetical protein
VIVARRFSSSFFSLAAFVAILGLAGASSAAQLVTTLADFEAGLEIEIVLDDAAGDPGDLVVTMAVTVGEGDLRGLFLNIADDSLLDGMDVEPTATHDDVTRAVFEAASVVNLGQGVNVNGDGDCPCDIGVRIGSPGMGRDDIQLTSFVLTHETEALTLDLFDGEVMMVRVTSVLLDEERTASSKIVGETGTDGGLNVPEPATTALLGFGMAVLAVRSRSFRPGRAAR